MDFTLKSMIVRHSVSVTSTKGLPSSARGVVDEDVDLAEIRDDPVCHGLNVRLPGQVRLDLYGLSSQPPYCIGGLAYIGCAGAGEGHVGAGLGQGRGQEGRPAATVAGDEGYLSGQVPFCWNWHFSPPRPSITEIFQVSVVSCQILSVRELPHLLPLWGV